MTDTCVYIHTRVSDGIVFYVGIGTIKRSEEYVNRNTYWYNVVGKHAYTVTILHKNLSWEQACAIEIELIAKYRAISGSKLCNVTDGGDGAKGNKHSPEARAKMSAAQKNKPPISEETRARLRESRKRQVFTEGTRARIGAANKNRSLESREKTSVALKGRTQSPDLVKRRTKFLIGVPKSEAVRLKISNSLSGRALSAESVYKTAIANTKIHVYVLRPGSTSWEVLDTSFYCKGGFKKENIVGLARRLNGAVYSPPKFVLTKSPNYTELSGFRFRIDMGVV